MLFLNLVEDMVGIKSLKPHQKNILLVLLGCIFGYLLSYFMFTQTLERETEKAYEIGFEFGQQSSEIKRSIKVLIIINRDSLEYN